MWITALHDGVGGCADRIPRESAAASTAGNILKYNWKEENQILLISTNQ